jgi:hypothetical protein
MTPLRLRILLAAALCLSTAALAAAPPDSAASPDAKAAFTSLKTLEGAWEGRLTTDPKVPEIPEGTSAKVWLRVTSMGNALMHEMKTEGRPDNPITMLYLDEGRLLLTHYCDAGNRPRMVAKPSTDGKTVAFEFLDVTGPIKYGHMHDAAFTMVDADHHVEEWTFHLAGDKHVRARFDLRRVQ